MDAASIAKAGFNWPFLLFITVTTTRHGRRRWTVTNIKTNAKTKARAHDN